MQFNKQGSFGSVYKQGQANSKPGLRDLTPSKMQLSNQDNTLEGKSQLESTNRIVKGQKYKLNFDRDRPNTQGQTRN